MSVVETAASPVIHAGRSQPLGATLVSVGVNFSIFSRSASSIELLLFDREDDGRPASVIPIDPAENRTYHYWHAIVEWQSAPTISGGTYQAGPRSVMALFARISEKKEI